jgi:hypothetical protein
MATLPTQVRPGDVISSELMNAILDALTQLQGDVSGTQLMPNFFGSLLSEARTAILLPSRQLALGFTFDVSGASIDPFASANAALIVLNQSPSAGTRVPPGTPVNLLVSRSGTSTPPPTPNPPTITRTETVGGVAASSFAVGAALVVVGTNFNATPSQNIVTFNSIAAASVTADPADPTRRLIVTVPTGIPGAPTTPGGPALPNVSLRVQTPNGAPATTTLTVTAPVAGQPTITDIAPLIQFEGSNITITGTNFTQTAQVRIENIAATVVSRTATTIVATVPNIPSITPGPPVAVSVVVSIPNTPNPPLEVTFTGTLRVVGVTP